MSSDYRKNIMEQDGENENTFASWMEEDNHDNVLVESVKGGGLKSLDDALLTATLADAALHAKEERKPSSPTDLYYMSDDNDTGWFDVQEGSFDFTSPSSPTSQTQQPSSFAQHTIEQQFRSLNGSEKSMQDPLQNLGTSRDSNSDDGSRESFGISMLDQDFQSPRKEPEHKKTTFANIIATPFGEQDDFLASESSLQTLDIFRDESSNKPPSSKSMLGDSSGDMKDDDDDDDDDSFGSAIDEDDDDKKIRRQMLYAIGGVGLFALMGFAGKNLLKLFDKTVKDTQDVDGGMDMTNVADQAVNVNDLATAVAGDGGSTYTSAAASATQNTTAFQASASASQSQMSMTGGFGMNPGAATSGNTMSAAQSQVMQTMAVNAASNAASSAATAASGLASAASAAAAAAAGTAAATTTAGVSTIAAVVRSSLYDEKFGALVFGSLAHLSLSFVTM
jgi:hypothetical protein